MTATQRFIEKAIEGGWKDNVVLSLDNLRESFIEVWVNHIHEAVLDPEAWKAVGKVEGWTDTDLIRSPENYATQMMVALFEGGTIESYLETIV